MSEPLSPLKLASEAKAAFKRGDYLSAAHSFEAAVQSFQATGDLLEAAEMANNCSVAYLKAGDANAALQAVDGTAAVFVAAGDHHRQGLALGNYAAALESTGMLAEAAEAYRQSAELLKAAGENDAYLHVMQSLSALQLRTGQQLLALNTMQAGLDQSKRLSPQQRVLKELLKIPFKILNR